MSASEFQEEDESEDLIFFPFSLLAQSSSAFFLFLKKLRLKRSLHFFLLLFSSFASKQERERERIQRR